MSAKKELKKVRAELEEVKQLLEMARRLNLLFRDGTIDPQWDKPDDSLSMKGYL